MCSTFHPCSATGLHLLIFWVLHSHVCNMHGTWIIVHVLKSLQMDLDRLVLHDVLRDWQKAVQSL